jgi:hypothetical protein
VVRESYTLKCRAVTRMKAQSTYLQHVFSSTCLWTIFRRAFSINFSVVDRRLIGRKFCDGKCDRRKQWLNKCVIWTSGLLGRCLTHSLALAFIYRPYAILSGLLVFWRHGALLFPGFVVCSSLQPPFVVFVSQVLRCELGVRDRHLSLEIAAPAK